MSLDPALTLGLLAKKLGLKLVGDKNKSISGLGTLNEANDTQVSFLSRSSYLKQLNETKAAAVILSEEHIDSCPCDYLISKDPYLSYAKASHVFKELMHTKKEVMISELSEVSPEAKLGKNISIGSYSVISDGAVIGDNVEIGSGVYIGKNSKIEESTIIYPNVSIYHDIEIGSFCIIHSGSVLGSDGLGFAKENGEWFKIEHLGKVILGTKVELGANCSIDRGSAGNTVLGNNVKLDNGVHIAHNVTVGDSTAIAANSAIAGSTQIGKNCTISGNCGIIDNIIIGDEVNITALTLVTKSILKPGTYSSGTPVMEHGLWKKNAVAFKKLKDLIKK